MCSKYRLIHRYITAPVVLITVALCLLWSGTVFGAIPQKEREALITLYHETLGDMQWHSKKGWKTPPLHTDGFAMPGTENKWFGVRCNKDNTHVVALLFNSNNLKRFIPAALANLTHLKVLQLNANDLYGSIPSELGRLKILEIFNVTFNKLSGTIPPELGNMEKLRELKFPQNRLTGPIPAELGQLKELEELRLFSNQLTGVIPPELGNLPELRYLLLHSNQLTGEIPSQLGNCSNLIEFNCNANQLEGAIPFQFGDLNKLERLDLSSNLLTGEIPPGLGFCRELRELDLGDNRLTGPIPPQLGNFVLIEVLNFQNNQLTGTIPVELGQLTKLTLLNLSHNSLTGTIPEVFSGLTGLNSLYLNYNSLEGAIPPQLGNLPNLLFISLASNKLAGPIPGELGNLSKLFDNQSDFRWNLLSVEDESLRDFLKTKQMGGDWENTQTVAPRFPTARPASATSVEVGWEPIGYSDGQGGYDVYYRETKNGSYILGGRTGSKHDYRFDITGLNRLTHYYFVVRTWSGPHRFNQNTLVSGYSTEASSGTQGTDKIISGRVTDKHNRGVKGVVLTFQPSNQLVVTDDNGYYEKGVEDGWSGSITPGKTHYRFEPAVREFEKVTAHRGGQDFTASLIPLNLNGRITSGGDGIPGVRLVVDGYDGEQAISITDHRGEYTHTVPYGWGGRVTPMKGDLLFVPSHMDYASDTYTTNKNHEDYRLKVSISLEADRNTDYVLLMKKEYAELRLDVGFVEGRPAGLRVIAIYRKEKEGAFQLLEQFPVDDSFPLIYHDKYLEKGKDYTYIIRAETSDGKVMGESREQSV